MSEWISQAEMVRRIELARLVADVADAVPLFAPPPRRYKWCGDFCKAFRPLDQFGRYHGSADGRQWRCRACASRRNRMRREGRAS